VGESKLECWEREREKWEYPDSSAERGSAREKWEGQLSSVERKKREKGR
jgi:hypothetical protein